MCQWPHFLRLSRLWTGVVPALVLLGGMSGTAKAVEPYVYNNMTGVGLSVGTVNGISAYQRLDDTNFVQGLLGFGGAGNYYLSGDYCQSYPGMFHWQPLVPYFCGGGFLAHFGEGWDNFGGDDKDRDGKTYLGGRIPVGVQIFIPKTPLQAFAELTPSIFVIPETEVFLQGNIGLRIVF